ncbi:hypothetical protein ACIP3A_08780 [Streptomyces tricolor]|uniref:hypothetical protein n=1 Tax=Streptomyces tricolor TaxID=68277 RepID=UPI0037F58665
MPLCPEIEPYAHGLLDVGDGNHVHRETSGDPDGTPALLLHGGPGSGSAPCARRLCDPAAYRIVQRGSGRSVPHASRHDTDMSVNDAPLLKGIPGTLVQGSLDLGSLLGTVWRLQHAWPGGELVIVDDAGHNAGAPGTAEALVAATDRDAGRTGRGPTTLSGSTR